MADRSTDAELARRLVAAERAYRKALAKTEALAQARNQAVWDCLDAGWSYPDVAAETAERGVSLSRQRIGQIAQMSKNYRPRGRQRP